MAAAPKWKVYDGNGDYQAACKEPEAAAVLVSWYGEGSTVRVGHAKRDAVWEEGVDGRGDESYDVTATTILERYQAIRGDRI